MQDTINDFGTLKRQSKKLEVSQPFHIMIKPCGPICNLACEYCYYLPNSNIYPQSDFRMDEKLLEEFTRQYIQAIPGHHITFTWQGGEPTLMGLDFYKKAVQLQKKYASRGFLVRNSLQTNGTLLTAEWCQFLKKNNFLVGISLDGPPKMHNVYRHNQSGFSHYRAILQSVKYLQQYKVDFNILCCVHKANMDYPLEVYHFLKNRINAEYIQFIPIVQKNLNYSGNGTLDTIDCSVKSEAYGVFLKKIFNEWFAEDIGKVFIQIFESAIGTLIGQKSSLCIFSRTCGRALVMEHNGDIYSCDHFVDQKNYLGNITKTPLVDLVESQKQIRFELKKFLSLSPNCLACDVRQICNGGCPKNRDEKGLNLLCKGYQSFFRYFENQIQELLEQLS